MNISTRLQGGQVKASVAVFPAATVSLREIIATSSPAEGAQSRWSAGREQYLYGAHRAIKSRSDSRKIDSARMDSERAAVIARCGMECSAACRSGAKGNNAR
jgi:hypothetical protein